MGKTKGGKAGQSRGAKPDRVRGKKDRNSSNKANGPALDQRLMADKRGQKAADKRNKSKGGSKKGTPSKGGARGKK